MCSCMFLNLNAALKQHELFGVSETFGTGWGYMCVCMCGLIVGHYGAGTARADSNVGVFNNAAELTGLFIRVKLK